MSKPEGELTLEKVVLQKTGIHVEVTAGPYTKRQLREMLRSAISLQHEESADLDGKTFGVDEEKLVKETGKKLSVTGLLNLIGTDEDRKKTDLERDLRSLLRGKGISDDLINRILKYGVTDEIIRLLKALGLNDEEIARLLGMWETLFERNTDSEESCSSAVSSSEEYVSVDGFYLISNFRNSLTKALRDVVRKKPWNPAEYLGHWLLNYKICEEKVRKQKEFHAELQAERERRRVEVITEPNPSEADEVEGELAEDWNFTEYEAD